MALGFIDSGFVRLLVMGLVVAELVDFVLGCEFCAVGCEVGHGGFLSRVLARYWSGWVAGCFLVGL